MLRKRIFLLVSCLFTFALMVTLAAPSASNAQSATAAATMAGTMAAMSATMSATMAGTAAAGALPAACGTSGGTVAAEVAALKIDPTKKPKIGFLFVGPVDDFGYNYAANQGRLCLEAIWPGSTVYAENVPENAEAERVMEKMIQDGATIIYPTSYGHFDPATRVAKKYPNVTFLHMGGPSTLPNLGTFFGNIWQMVYLSGVAAAKVSKSGKLGYIVAFPIPQTLLNVNAFELGAQSVNPKVTTTVVFTGSWCDPAKMTSASDTLIDQGIDVLTMHQDCPKPIIEEAARKGAMVVGYHADGSSVAPKAWVTGSMWVWGPTMIEITNQIISGTFKPSLLRYGPAEGIVDLAPFGPGVPQDVRDMVNKLKAGVIDGSVFPFTGPISDQSGKVVIAAGVKPDEATLETMNYLVNGVIGTMPQ